MKLKWRLKAGARGARPCQDPVFYYKKKMGKLLFHHSLTGRTVGAITIRIFQKAGERE